MMTADQALRREVYRLRRQVAALSRHLHTLCTELASELWDESHDDMRQNPQLRAKRQRIAKSRRLLASIVNAPRRCQSCGFVVGSKAHRAACRNNPKQTGEPPR